MNLRGAELKDKDAILKIVDLLYLKIPKFVWCTGDFVEKQIKNGEYFVAEENGEIAGIVSFRQRGNKMHIETIAVAASFQSRGVGKMLIDFAKDFTKKNGLDILHVYSFLEYDKKDFYLNQGFSLLKKPGKYGGHKYYRFEIKLG